ncbi:MAG: ATP-binding cassette domain-containing protein [Deltaproteobacteria bacterium]|nr:ATP-binding cassette domain-containing protein [Deltaproteobacteria bacterium]
MIEVEGLTKYYGPVPGIKDVTFCVEKGEILGFLGPNGAGKTTTMRILTCFMPPSSGTARVKGFDVFKDSLEVRRRVGYMPENVPLYTDMPVRAYLSLVAELKGVRGRLRRAAVDRAIEECGLQGVNGRYIGKLSKGYRQRVGLAQALIHDPEVLILDEPTIGLDPRQIIEIRRLIRNLKGERTVILSSHILPEVSQICDNVIIINKGCLVAEKSTPEELDASLKRSNQVFLQVDGPSSAIISALKNLDGVLSVAQRDEVAGHINNYVVESMRDIDVRRHIAATVADNGWGLLELRSIGLSLEDIFIQLVTEETHSEVPLENSMQGIQKAAETSSPEETT